MPHRVVALVSGGKDSCYSMMKCVEHGHEVVAIANLHPPSAVGEELDSHMYQTVGHAHIGAIAEAMELPLFRREITGTAVEQRLRYGATPGDEVEDLYELLSQVKAQMPEVTAVCSGAILSNYQRSRVESVCERLGLASLAFLWQREQAPLLDEMIAHRVEAVLVKVASLGLDSKHLGRTIGALQPHFLKLESQFGFHVCGEGGEYETFTLDCPLFKRRIDPIGAKTMAHGGGAAILSFESVVLNDKLASGGDEDSTLAKTAEEGEEGEEADAAALEVTEEEAGVEATWRIGADGMPYETTSSSSSPPPFVSTDLGGGLVHVAACGVGLSSSVVGDDAGDGSPASQLTIALARVRSALRERGLDLDDVLMTRLYVADIREYQKVNAAFAAAFNGLAPAARLAIQLPLPAMYGDSCGVAVECTAWAGAKELLHVQSVSEWAPRMIGPYAQLTCGLGVTYVAGSLGLVPASMTLADGGAAAQTRQALRNCAQTLRGVSQSAAGALALVLYITHIADAPAVRASAAHWLRRVTERPAADAAALPPMLLVRVGALPIGALVEAELQACPPHLPSLYRARWTVGLAGAANGLELLCDAALSGLLPPATSKEATTTAASDAGMIACGVAYCLVRAEDDAIISLAQLGQLLGEAVSQLDSRLRDCQHGLQLGSSLFARALVDEALPVRTSALGEALTGAVAAAGPWRCEALVLPVSQVVDRRARLVVQLNFTAVTTAATTALS